jgi:hypothetical protein
VRSFLDVHERRALCLMRRARSMAAGSSVSGSSCSNQAAIHGPKALIAAKKDPGPPGPRRQADARFALQGMHTLKKPKMRNRCVHSRLPESARHLAADANPSERADHFGIRISIGTDGMLKSSPHAAAPHSMFTFGPTPSDDCVRRTLDGDFHRRRLGHPGLARTQPSREAVGVPPFPSKRSRPPRVWIAAAHLRSPSNATIRVAGGTLAPACAGVPSIAWRAAKP